MNCTASGCTNESVIHIAEVAQRRLTAERQLCDLHGREYFHHFRSSSRVGQGQKKVAFDGICVDLELLAYHRGFPDRQACVYLHEIDGKRRFATLIDGWAWWSLMALLRKEVPPRPPTHMAWNLTIDALGGSIDHVIVDAGSPDIMSWYAAKIRINMPSQAQVEIDVRASDAYCLAVSAGVPIVATELLFSRAGDPMVNTSP